MHGYFLFPCRLPSQAHEQALVIYCATSQPDPEDFEEHLRRYCDHHSPPDRIYVIASNSEQIRVQQAIASEAFVNRLPSVTRHLHTPTVHCHFFDATGSTSSDELVRAIQRLGMTYIFRHRNAMLEATSAHHYVKPSERHCNKFLRTGNALVDGAEIDFLAFCCLSKAPSRLRHIYCDTGAISPIAHAVVGIRKRLDQSEPWATIDSFGSYEGMKHFQFREMSNSMVLLSASTSGGLARSLMETEPLVTHDRLATIFYLGEPMQHGAVVCDLGYHANLNPEGYEPLVSFPPHECQLCAQGSTAIPIAGDQFLPEGIRVDAVIIRAQDSPAWAGAFVKDVRGTEFVRLNYLVPHSTGATKDIFFDVQRLVEHPEMLNIGKFQTRFHRILDHGISKSVQRILHLNDAASGQMARCIHIAANLGADVQVIALGDVEQQLDQHIHEDGLTVVVAGVVASGSSLLAASQVLRHIQKNSAINYMIGLARTPDKESLRELRGHVTYGEQADEHGFHLMERVYLPMFRAGRQTSWDRERVFLLQLIEATTDGETRALLEQRLSEIDAAASVETRGMVNQAFYRRLNGDPLVLRPGFAFLNFDYAAGEISQAEVYYLISATLHHLRQRAAGPHSLVQHGHVRKVISPRCFERFNDGVIQAALLRAASPPELDYSLSEQLSNEMERILDFVFTNSANESGEAAREFALALGMDQLRLMPESIARLKDEHSDGGGDPLLRAVWSLVRIQE